MYKPVTTKPGSIASRERTFRVVNATLGTQTGQAAEILNGRFAPGTPIEGAPEGAQLADYRVVFTDLGGELGKARQEMHAANTAHLGQLAMVVDLQKQRQELFEQLFARYSKVRHGLDSFYGKGQGFETLAITGDTPRDPTGLIQQVRQTVDFLDHPRVELPSIDLDGVRIDPKPLAAQLRSGADELEDVLVGIDLARKNAETTRKAKNDAIAEFDRRYRWVGQALETYFHLAGMHEVAERVRPSIRRSGRRAADDPEQGSGEVQPQEDTPPADAPASDTADA